MICIIRFSQYFFCYLGGEGRLEGSLCVLPAGLLCRDGVANAQAVILWRAKSLLSPFDLQ